MLHSLHCTKKASLPVASSSSLSCRPSGLHFAAQNRQTLPLYVILSETEWSRSFAGRGLCPSEQNQGSGKAATAGIYEGRPIAFPTGVASITLHKESNPCIKKLSKLHTRSRCAQSACAFVRSASLAYQKFDYGLRPPLRMTRSRMRMTRSR